MSPGFGHRSRMFPSIFSAHFLWLHVQSACGSARVLPTSEASVPVHPELQRWPLRALSPPPPITPTATVIQRLLFFPVFAWCAQSATVTARRGPAEPDHTEPCVVLIQLPTPRLDNSPWREAPEKWIRPLVLTFFPVHLPPGQERPWLSQLSSEPSPSSTGSILLASILQQDVDYFPAARFTSLIQRHLWSQSWNGRWTPEDVQTTQAAHADHGDFLLQQESIQVHLGRFHRALSPVKHNTQDQDHPSAEEALSISHAWRKVWVTASFQ